MESYKKLAQILSLLKPKCKEKQDGLQNTNYLIKAYLFFLKQKGKKSLSLGFLNNCL